MTMSLALNLLWMGSLFVLAILSAFPRLWGPYLLGILGFIVMDVASMVFMIKNVDGPAVIVVPLIHLFFAGIACIAHAIRWVYEVVR
ncbi:hypothetical protein SB11R_12135 [Pseudomonas oryzihabitans]|nr:hypothetical protein SB11R_12135 [Pseudomonas psychrotolerans]